MKKKKVWQKADLELSNGTKFSIVHDIFGKGNINSIDAALDNWLARTEDYTAESFVDYINSKGVHKAMTMEQFELSQS